MFTDFLKRSFVLILLSSLTLPAVELLPPGNRPLPLGVHALVGAKVFVKPNEVLDSATIVIRDGFIEAVGKNLQPPTDARTLVAQICTFLYFGFFLLMPWWSAMGTFKRVPDRVTFEPHSAVKS